MIRPRRTAVRLDITNPKVASLAPTWRRQHGVSVLFDNPGAHAPAGVVPLAAIRVTDPGRQRLYDELAAALAADGGALQARYGLCPLPRPSYHVTVCDGPNERHALPPVAALLEGLPASLAQVDDDLRFLVADGLRAVVADNPVRLAVGGIVVWGHVLAGRLAPADPDAAAALRRVARAREALVRQLWGHLRLRTQRWRPHVSLGYFPNRAAAAAARDALPTDHRELQVPIDSSITFESAALYGFTDMASFHRLA